MGPALFRMRLPHPHWRHFCKLVRAIHIHQQHKISQEELQEATDLLLQFTEEFEELYVKRRPKRLHFVQPWLHTLLHVSTEVMRVGPTGYYTQWTMERVIGFLEDGLRQHSNPYTNLAHVALRHSQASALKAMLPDLGSPMDLLPKGALDLGDGYSLRRATDSM